MEVYFRYQRGDPEATSPGFSVLVEVVLLFRIGVREVEVVVNNIEMD